LIRPEDLRPVCLASRPEPGVQDCSPLLVFRNRLGQRAKDAQRRNSGSSAHLREPHPGAHAGRSRPIRPEIIAERFPGRRSLRQLEDHILDGRHDLRPDLDQILPQGDRVPVADRPARAECRRAFASADDFSANVLATAVDMSGSEEPAPQSMTMNRAVCGPLMTCPRLSGVSPGVRYAGPGGPGDYSPGLPQIRTCSH